jgi:hypothetical protein
MPCRVQLQDSRVGSASRGHERDLSRAPSCSAQTSARWPSAFGRFDNTISSERSSFKPPGDIRG